MGGYIGTTETQFFCIILEFVVGLGYTHFDFANTKLKHLLENIFIPMFAVGII